MRHTAAAASLFEKNVLKVHLVIFSTPEWCSHMLESVIDTRFSTNKYSVVDSTREYGLYAATGGAAGVPCLQFSRQPPSV